jgi:hypothetical protein
MNKNELARLVVAYAEAHGLEISNEANALWDACEDVLGTEISDKHQAALLARLSEPKATAPKGAPGAEQQETA